MNKCVVGVDPGKTGAYCFLPLNGDSIIFVQPPSIGNNVDVSNLLRTIKELSETYDVVACAMEDVHAIFGSSAKSTFQFGWINGIMEASLYNASIPFRKIQPKAWQAVSWNGIEKILVNTGKKTSTGKIRYKVDTKSTSLLAARRLFPKETFLATARSKKPHDGLIDAALIAHCVKSTLVGFA